MKRALIAVGGNAILRRGEEATVANQVSNLKATCRSLVSMVKENYALTLVHGNGPQVGNILLQNELVKDEVPPMPLDVCVAESQGQIGYLIEQALAGELEREGLNIGTICVLTRTLVDDKTIESLTKPIGPYYSKEEAEKICQDQGLDHGRG